MKCKTCGFVNKVVADSIKRRRNGELLFLGCKKCRSKKYHCEYCGDDVGIAKEIKHWYKSKPFCSEGCIDKYKENMKCIICGKVFEKVNENNIVCKNEECKKEYYNIKLQQKNIDRIENFKSEEKICKYCGGKFLTEFKRSKTYCSELCKKKMNNYLKKINDSKRAERMKNNGEVDEDITLPKLYKKHNGICAICGEECNYNDYIKTEDGHYIVGNMYPSIDHIIPLAKSGTHTWDNVQLAHRLCNSYKSDRFIEEREGQLRLF